MSQEELADKINVTRQSISLWETDQTTPSLDNLVMLAEIFSVGLDELCGKLPERTETAERSAETDGENGRIAYTETKYTAELISTVNAVSARKFYILGYLLIIFSVFVGIGIVVAPDTNNLYLIAPVTVAILGALLLVRLAVSLKKSVKNFIEQRPNSVAKMRFYGDRIEAEMTSDNAESKFTVKLDDIKKVKTTGNYLLIFFNGTVIPIEKKPTDADYLAICGLFKVRDTKASAMQSRAAKIALLTLFILSLLSVFFALISVAVAMQMSPLPEYTYAMPEHMWIFFTFIPLPLASAVLGIIFYVKKYKCKKNIIAGFIMCALLAVYGSFSPIYKDYSRHDFEYVTELEQTLSIDLPDSGYASYALNPDEKTNAFAMIKFDDREEIASAVMGDARFSRDTDSVPSGIVGLGALSATSDYDYFLLHDVTCGEIYNVEGDHDGHRFVFVAYNVDKNIMYVKDFVA